MPFLIRPARPEEGDAVLTFYDKLMNALRHCEYQTRWERGVYPENEMILSAVERGEMFLALQEGRIVGAMVLNRAFNEGYADVVWPSGAKGSEVMGIHLLCVWPELSRRGIGRRLVEAAVAEAECRGTRALRLDVLEGNLPAERLYQSCGFVYVDHRDLFYENTGRIGFELYELPIQEKRTDTE